MVSQEIDPGDLRAALLLLDSRLPRRPGMAVMLGVFMSSDSPWLE